MDPLTLAAASGLRSRMESLSLLANNLANSTTSGYKVDREFYGVYASGEASGSLGPPSTMPVIERQWTDFSQGTIEVTGNQLDVALSGPGMLAVNGPKGVVYTRSGNLRIAPGGELTVGDGFKLRAAGGDTIRVDPGKAIDIAPDGTVSQQGRAIGRIEVVNFNSTASLRKMSGTCFENTDPANAPVAATGVEILQGKLEASNVAVPEAAMRLVGIMRQFEMLQKAVTMGVDMNARAIQEVARVG